MFSRVNSLGWALFEELTSAQMNALDLNVSRSIDGAAGGTYNLSAPLVINGTMTVTNLNLVGGTFENLDVTHTITCEDLDVDHDIGCRNITANQLSVTTLICSALNYARFNGAVQIHGNVTQDAGNFTYAVHGFAMEVIDGTFRVSNDGNALFQSAVQFDATSTVTVTDGCVWSFYNETFFNASSETTFRGTTSFNTRPRFYQGVTFEPGNLINYQTARTWIIQWPFGLGGAMHDEYINTNRYRYIAGKWVQASTSAGSFYSLMHPGLAGGTAFTITQADFRCRAENLSGSTVGPTYFELVLYSEAMVALDQKQAQDATPNNATVHSATWTAGGSPLAYNPDSNILGMYFHGYNGGDTALDGTTKWYEILSCRLTCSTMAQGAY